MYASLMSCLPEVALVFESVDGDLEETVSTDAGGLTEFVEVTRLREAANMVRFSIKGIN